MAAKKDDMQNFWQQGEDRDKRREQLAQAVERPPAKLKRINADVDPATHRAFKRWADDRGGMRAVLQQFIGECVNGAHDEDYPERLE